MGDRDLNADRIIILPRDAPKQTKPTLGIPVFGFEAPPEMDPDCEVRCDEIRDAVSEQAKQSTVHGDLDYQPALDWHGDS